MGRQGLTTAGIMADTRGHKSEIISLLASGLEALEDLVDFWPSARRQRNMVKQRLEALLTAMNGASDFNGPFCFGRPMQSPFGLDQDIVYGGLRRASFEALRWYDGMQHRVDFHQLD